MKILNWLFGFSLNVIATTFALGVIVIGMLLFCVSILGSLSLALSAINQLVQ